MVCTKLYKLLYVLKIQNISPKINYFLKKYDITPFSMSVCCENATDVNEFAARHISINALVC